jgi:hypothetical protein
VQQSPEIQPSGRKQSRLTSLPGLIAPLQYEKGRTLLVSGLCWKFPKRIKLPLFKSGAEAGVVVNQM